MAIPVRNFYYLLCYAWDRLAEAKVAGVSAGSYAHLPDLFARVLASGLEHLLKRGMDRGYQEHHEDVAGVRGRIDFAASIKRQLFDRGRAACVTEELTADVPHNRILKRTALDLANVDGLDGKLADLLRACAGRMAGVSAPPLTAQSFGRVQLHGNIGFYDFLLKVCRLVYDAAVVDQAGGHVKFRDFERDERAMAGLFERFLLNFYRREQMTYLDRSRKLDWGATAADPAHLALLPEMRTDVSLESPGRVLVVDAKYYKRPLAKGNFGKDTVRSGHLYQLFAYLRSVERGEAAAGTGTTRAVDGLLVYPQVGDAPLDLQYAIGGHGVRVATVDLAADWPAIHDRLLALVAQA